MSEYKFTELQEKWLQALESGEYKQCTHQLHDGKGFCCLGVACMVLGIPPVLVEGEYDEDGHKHGEDHFHFDGSWEGAPDSVVSRLKLRDELGHLAPNDTIQAADSMYDRLAYANDNGVTFSEIAAFIRANPEKVFLP